MLTIRMTVCSLRRVTKNIPVFLQRVEWYINGTAIEPGHSSPNHIHLQPQNFCRWFGASSPTVAPPQIPSPATAKRPASGHKRPASDHKRPASKDFDRPGKPKAFNMREYLAEGGAKKPWYQMWIELAVAEDQGNFMHPADLNRLVHRCAMEGNHEAALEIHYNYKDVKFWPGRYHPTRRRSDVSLRAMSILLGLFYHERVRHALDLVAELSQDVGSRHVLFDLLLLQCARNGDESEDERGDGVRQLTVRDGLRVVESMVSIGLRPTRIGMEALIDCCDAALDAKMAEEIVWTMEEEYGLPPTIVTLVRLLRACINAEDEDRALRVLDRIPREDLRSRDMQLFVMQTLLLQYEQAAESREAAEAPESMPRLRKKLDELLLEARGQSDTTPGVGDWGLS